MDTSKEQRPASADVSPVLVPQIQKFSIMARTGQSRLPTSPDPREGRGRRAAYEAQSSGDDTSVEGVAQEEEGKRLPCRTSSSLLFDDDLMSNESPQGQLCMFDPESVRIIYRETCRKHDLVPCRKYLRDVEHGRAILNNQGLGQAGIRAICVSLASNLTIKELHLAENRLGPHGMQLLAEMFKLNAAVRVLDVSNNDLGSDGARILGSIVETSDYLLSVRAQANTFRDAGARFIGEALKHTSRLSHLDISRNHFEDSGGAFIGEGLAANTTLQSLDLSYNCLRKQGITAISQALKGETILKSLNLAWNGVEETGAKQLAAGLAENPHLVTLDLTGCRINVNAVGEFFKNLGNNTTFKSINLSKNPLTSADAIGVLSAVKSKPECSVDSIQLSEIAISEDFLKELEELRNVKPSFTAICGDVLDIFDLRTDRIAGLVLAASNPMDILVQYIKAKDLDILELFESFDEEYKSAVSRQDLIRGMQNTGLMMSISQMNRLMMILDADGKGEVDRSDIMRCFNFYLKKMRRKSNVYSRFDEAIVAKMSEHPEHTLKVPSYQET